MRAIIIFKVKSDPSIVTSIGGKVVDELNGIPKLLTVDITDEMACYLVEHHLIEGVYESKKFPIKRNSTYAKETSSFAWHLNALRVDDYWSRGLTGKGIKIGIIDHGVDHHYNVPLAGGYDAQHPDTPDYFDTITNDDNPQLGAHGTQTASCIVGKLYKGTTGMIGGTAPEVSLYAIRAEAGAGDVFEDVIVRAINYTIENNMDIVSLSLDIGLSNQTDFPAMYTAFDTLLGTEIILVMAAGNTGSNADFNSFPRNDPRIVTVGGIDSTMKWISWATYGSNLTFVGPADNIEMFDRNSNSTNSSQWNNATNIQDGTSFATPLVAGIFALYKQAYPTKTKNELISLMIENARKLAGKTGWDQFYGHGIPQPSPEILSMPKISKNKGISMFGNGEYIDCGNNVNLDIQNNLTLIAKVRQNHRSSGHIFAKANTDGSKVYYGLKLGDDGIYAYSVGSGTQRSYRFYTAVGDNRDHTVSLVYSGGTSIYLYVDGQQIPSTLTLNGMDTNSASKLYIGSDMGTAGSFAGSIYSTKVYNRALSPSEILSDYQGSLVTGNLQLNYRFDGGESVSVSDLSTGNNSGSLIGTRSAVLPSNTIYEARNLRVQLSPATDISATPYDHSIALSWTPVSYPSVKYEIYKEGSIAPIATTTGNSYTISGLQSSTLYGYNILAIDAGGRRSAKTSLQATTLADTTNPTQVTGLSASGITDTSLTLVWTAPSSTDVALFGHYEVYQAISGTAFGSATLLSGNVKNTNYYVSNLTNSTAYSFWVVAVDGSNNKSSATQYNTTTAATKLVLINDSFTRTNASSLGSPDVAGVGNTWAVSDATKGYGTNGTQAYALTTGSVFTSPAYQSINSKDYEVEMTVPVNQTYVYMYVRYVDSNNFIAIGTDTTNWKVFKRTSGTYSDPDGISIVGGDTGIAWANSDTVKIVTTPDGNLVFYVNGVVAITASDTSFINNTNKVGFGMGNSTLPSARIDNFKVYVARPYYIAYDTFNNRTSASGLGSPEIGQFAYTYGTTTWNITSGVASPNSSPSPSWLQPAQYAVNTNSYSVEAKFTSMGLYTPLLYVRYVTSYTNCVVVSPKRSSSGIWTLQKWVTNGTPTDLVDTGVTAANGDVIKVECLPNGTMTIFVNGVNKGSVVDTFQQTATTKVGFGGSDTTVQFDDFKVVVL